MALPGLVPAAGRVRRLRLRAADQVLVRRGAALLEDALQTAASGLGRPGRLTVVRRLAVGRIASDRAPAHLSLRVESHLRQLADGARHWSAPGAAGAEAVYFEDELAPYLGLATCLAIGAEPEAWFWPLAVPGWRPAAHGRALPALLFEVATSTRAGPLAAVEFVRTLQEDGTAEALLGALRPADGPALLALFGWSETQTAPPPPPPRAGPAEPHPPPAWTTLLERWVESWGQREPRSTWLAAVALLAERPARLLDPTLRQHAERLAQALAAPRQTARPPTARPRRQPAGPAPGRPVLVADRGARPTATDAPEPVGPLRAGRPDQRSVGASHGRPAPLPGPAAGASSTSGRPATERSGLSPRQPLPLPAVPPATLAPPPLGPDLPSPSRGRPAKAAQPSHSDRRTGPSTAAEPEQPGPAGPAPTPTPTPTAEGWRSDYAGLFYLLPALDRLGMAELLTVWPGLIELDLPARVLAEVGRRVGAPADDPLWRLLAAPDAAPPGGCTFSLPPRLSLLASPGSWLIRREAGPAGAWALVDRSERLTLAVWHGRRPAPVRALLRGRRPEPGRRLPPDSGLALLLESWYTALRRWCRRCAGLSLAEVARRPGRLLATRTHLDLFFDPRQADVRLRRAGLDLDPGWIAWFGRVVLFHYQESV